MTAEDCYAAAIDALRELADVLSDEAADRAADLGGVGHKTPAGIARIYDVADVLQVQVNARFE
jgi:hypothetical protein